MRAPARHRVAGGHGGKRIVDEPLTDADALALDAGAVRLEQRERLGVEHHESDAVQQPQGGVMDPQAPLVV